MHRAVYNQLLTVICLMLTVTDVQSPHPYGPMNLTGEQKAIILDHHNKLRRQEGSSSMELMAWNESLAETAMMLAKQCRFDHWHKTAVELPSGGWVPRRGQNLAMNTVKFESYTYGIQLWYDEKIGYNYDTRQCDTSKVSEAGTCGHYTQVVWASSRQVGCTYAVCNGLTQKGKQMKNAQKGTKVFYLVCDYLPAGNMQDKNHITLRPYKKGPPCSQCTSGAGWCSDRLCNSSCSAEGKGCLCEARCHSSSKLDEKTCRCKCAAGWTGPTCTERCKDHEKCGASPGWPRKWCKVPKYYHQMNLCPALCGKCKMDLKAKPRKFIIVEYGRSSTPTMTFNMTEQQLMLMMMMLMMTVVLLSISSNAALL